MHLSSKFMALAFVLSTPVAANAQSPFNQAMLGSYTKLVSSAGKDASNCNASIDVVQTPGPVGGGPFAIEIMSHTPGDIDFSFPYLDLVGPTKRSEAGNYPTETTTSTQFNENQVTKTEDTIAIGVSGSQTESLTYDPNLQQLTIQHEVKIRGRIISEQMTCIYQR